MAINPRTNELLDRWLDRHPGWKKSTVMELLMEFFAAAPHSFQLVMLRNVPLDLQAGFLEAANIFVASTIQPEGPSLKVDIGVVPEATDTDDRPMQQPPMGPRPRGR